MTMKGCVWVAMAVAAIARVGLSYENLSLNGTWDFKREGAVAWQKVTVPHDWAIAGPFDPNGRGERNAKLPCSGKGTYRRTFDWQGGKDDFAYLEFDGVMALPEVYLNGQKVGGWDFGYIGFVLDVTKSVKVGENVLEVRCDSPGTCRWYPGGGLYRDVRLVRRTGEHVKPWSLAIVTKDISEQAATVCVSYETPSARTNYSFTVTQPRLWDVDDPYLYELELYGEKFRYGIRTARFTVDDGFHLNGRRVDIRGVNLHSDLGPLGMAFDRAAAKRQLLLMKEMGANALRTSHNPAAPQLLDLCDELGIVVWNECFDRWDGNAGKWPSDSLEDYVGRNLAAFVRRDRNHPCVVAWSMGNEIPPADKAYPLGLTKDRVNAFQATIKANDATRQVTLGCCYTNAIGLGILDDIDMTGWNYRALYRLMKAKYPDKPVLCSESASALSSYGFYKLPHPTNQTDFAIAEREVDSYDWNATCWSDIVDREFERMEKDRYCAGEFVWTGIDYMGEPTPYTRWNFKYQGIREEVSDREMARSSYFGAADLCGIPKDRFYLYRAHWRKDAVTVHILPHWNWEGREGQNVPVYVYSNGDEVELFVNGVSQGRKANDGYRFRFEDVVYRPGVVRAVAYAKGKEIGCAEMKTAGAPRRIVLTRDPFGAGFVQVDVVDANGVRCPKAANRIRFSLKGPGRIAAVGNGNARGLDSFADVSSHPLYFGKAVVILRRTPGQFGELRLEASADGLESAEYVDPPFKPLAGDGVTDDTEAIQERLDSGLSCVYLPPPKKAYLISKMLKIGSETELRLDRFSVIRLAPKSNCPMIENRGYVGGDDRRLAITGGIWDMANRDQSPNPQQYRHCTPPRKGRLPPKHENAFFFGMAMRFSHVTDMTVKGVTVRNPTSYGMAFCHASYVSVEDVTFDYRTWNPIALNLDGVHFDGHCHHLRIANLRGTCFDDLVALNANDGQCAQEEGPITDVDIDGIYADYCHSAVRLLSTGEDLKRVTIRNVHGNFYTYVVGLTHFFNDRKTRGVFDDIVISDVFAAKAFSPESINVYSRTNYPPIWVQGPVDVGKLTVQNYNRDERLIPVPSIRVDARARVDNLIVRNCRMRNLTKAAIPFFDLKGRVGTRTVEGNEFRGKWVSRDLDAQERLAISFSIWALYDMDEGGTWGDCDKTMRELKERGFNCVRLDDGAGLYNDPDGKPRGKVHVRPAFGKYAADIRQMSMITTERDIDIRENLLKFFRAADRHGIKVILSSWYYIHTNWSLDETINRQLYEGLTTERKMAYFTDELNCILALLRENRLDHCVAFAELFNEFDGLPFTGRYRRIEDASVAEHLRDLHEKALARLKTANPGIRFAYDVASADIQANLIPRNADILNFHCYYFWSIYHVLERGSVKDTTVEIPISPGSMEFLRNPPLTIADIVATRQGNLRVSNDWNARVRLYASLDDAKLPELERQFGERLVRDYDKFVQHLEQAVDRVVKTRDAVLPGAPIVLGEGVSYCAANKFLFEERSELFWNLLLEQSRILSEAGLMGAVPRTNSGPEEPGWYLNEGDLRRVNRAFTGIGVSP